VATRWQYWLVTSTPYNPTYYTYYGTMSLEKEPQVSFLGKSELSLS